MKEVFLSQRGSQFYQSFELEKYIQVAYLEYRDSTQEYF